MRPLAAPEALALDPLRRRQDFPLLARSVYGKRLVYLDNAATTQKPRQVLEAVQNFYERKNSNVHRGVHVLSQEATEAYEGARRTMASFLGAQDPAEIVFTRGTTEAINLVAFSYARSRIRAGEEILLTRMEHHSNIVPWQLLAEQTGAILRVAPMRPDGTLDREGTYALLSPRTKLLAFVHVSNALGTINPVAELARAAHEVGAKVLVDGAQAASHLTVNVAELDVDFYAVSGHKMYGPTGIGVLWTRREILESMPPWQGGGDMIRSVSFQGTTYNDIPHRFEAGTPNIAGAVGMAAAADYLQEVGRDAIAHHEATLLAYGAARLEEIQGLRPIGTAPAKAAVLAFVLDGAHPHDIGTILDREGVAIRTGHHCAQPVMEFYGVPATARASLGLYNTMEDLDALVAGLHRVREILC